MKKLLQKATETYNQNFKPTAWYGRCIFLSWYCDLGTCKFCFRSTIKHKIRHAKTAKRTIGSILVEALLAKNLGWRIEFLTGGYKIFPVDELVKITEMVTKVYGEKIWLNLGALKKEELEKFKPHIEGIAASIETINPELHNKICPDKPIKPYEEMFENAKDLKKSITIVIGLGEKREDFELLKTFIKKYKLDRITFYALKPVKGTPYIKGPDIEDYLWWIAQTRINFPKLEIMAGTTPRRYGEVDLLLKAGANSITKFSATKLFGTDTAKTVAQKVKDAGREFTSELINLPDIDWEKQINELDLDDELKKEIKEKLNLYLKRMQKPKP
ncbi:radical SAM protein [Candidatus Woesearchaeota archaeon]|nr:radical SAM protein [Candidatus Woesearchaeota archaeon]